MRKIYLSGLLCFLVMSAIAQKTAKPRHEDLAKPNPNKIEFMKGKMIVCPGMYVDANTYVPPAKEIQEYLSGRRARSTAKATFIVDYTGFTPAAKAAFQLAVDIWSNLITSPVPIRIQAIWHPIDSDGVSGTILGQASPADFTRNFPGQQKASTWYPIALAEKIAGQELNSVNEPDIVAEFNSSAPWYLGTSTPGRNEFDFASIVLHELCHGLGFTSSLRSTATTTTAAWGYETGSPFIFDHFVENNTSQLLIDTGIFPNPSTALRQQLTGNNLFFNSPISADKGDEKPRLYAPSTYQAGSSTSHVDDNTYTSGNPNSLMTSVAKFREVVRDPGPLVLNMFADMGWKGTSLLHTPNKNIENFVSTVTIKATILSDTTLIANTAKLYYTENDTVMANAKVIDLKRVGVTNDYTAVVPVSRAGSVIRYYMVVEDNYKRKNTAPAEAPLFGFYGFQVGSDDTAPPFISALPITFVSSSTKPDVFLNAEDGFEHGIDTVYVEYMVNGQQMAPIGLKKYNPITDDPSYSQGRNDVYAYLGKAIFGDLQKGDHVLYRLVAIDKSKNKNKAILPSYYNTPGQNVRLSPDYFEFVVTDLTAEAPVLQYSTDFNTPNEDFAGIGGWGITQPTGFSNGALHSAHPYKNGGDENFESNTIALFLKPIELKSNQDSANITFDEVVLVEPGAPGSVFGEGDFFDYVVVEGSYDGGVSWVPFEVGYDARSNSVWQRAFESDLVKSTVVGTIRVIETEDSRAAGTSAMYRTRTIKMLRSGDFAGGDIVLIRFRLFSDELYHGWGWAIDNLKIQFAPPPPVLAVEPGLERATTISPNPSPDEIQVSTTLAKPGRVTMEVYGTNGKRIMAREYITDVTTFNQKIDVSDFNAGSYLVRLYTENGTIVKRFVVNR